MGAFAVCFVVTVSWRIGVVNARRNRYKEFDRNYPAKADFERMKRVGVFNCLKQEEEKEAPVEPTEE